MRWTWLLTWLSIACLVLFVLFTAGSWAMAQDDPGIGHVELRWAPNTETNLIGYRVYVMSGTLGLSPSPILYCGPGDAACCVYEAAFEKGKPKTWGIVAIDIGGQESQKTTISLASLVGDPPAAPTGVTLMLLP